MKSTGITRPVDSLGRIVIPKELRNTMRIEEGSILEIFTEPGNKIVLTPHGIRCSGCGNDSAIELQTVKGVTLCGKCVKRFESAFR